jgi:hypothetical protein
MPTNAAKKPPESMPSEPDPGECQTFQMCIDRLSDGKEYNFTTPGLTGYFHKAPYPSRDADEKRDGACSAISYRDKLTGKPASPTLMLDELQEDSEPTWVITQGPWRG